MRRSRVKGVDGITERAPKTERGRRTIDIDAGTVGVLRRWKVVQLEERMAWGGAYQDHHLMVSREDGSPLDPDVASDRLAKIARAAELPLIRFHDLRHTHASLLLAAGVPAHVVSQRLGHASVGFTLQVYGHVLPQQQAEAIARLAAALEG